MDGLILEGLAKMVRTFLFFIALNILQQAPLYAQDRALLFGDTHLHTSYSLDAYLNGNQTADPDTAYRFARGMPVIHPFGRNRVQIETPLDFLVVSDHAELMGVVRAAHEGTDEFEDLGWWGNLKRWVMLKGMLWAVEKGTGGSVLNSYLPRRAHLAGRDPVAHASLTGSRPNPFGDTSAIETTAWHEIIAAAEAYNSPGEFTSFMGWEWSSIPAGANLHRIVLTPDGGDIARRFTPFGSDQSEYPMDLWQWMEKTQAETGARFISMPHNSNVSKGYMYDRKTLKQEPISTEYAERRMRWEPVSEVTQIKGDSESHPLLSPDDEFADFETFAYNLQGEWEEYRPSEADYIRSALKIGLEIERSVGVNPYQFGVIGSTDAHTGLSSAEEANFWGKFARDALPETKTTDDLLGASGSNGWSMAAAGLAAVWADSNTREDIFAALHRKEVYATTGTRLKVRVFGGWDFVEGDVQSNDFAKVGYERGVPMGGELMLPVDGDAEAPRFMVRTEKDPKGANLDRIQIVKGWLDSVGVSHERVYNVSWSGERQLDEKGGLPPVGSTVDNTTGEYENSIGAAVLYGLWVDPDFDASQSAFYYVRVLEIPTPRHSLLDHIALNSVVPLEGPATIQERAYTSPIWLVPASN